MYQHLINGASERSTKLSPGKSSRVRSAKDKLWLSFDDILRVLRGGL